MQSLEWSDKALFGLVSGGHRWHLQPTGKKVLGILGKNRTQVTLDQEITGASFHHTSLWMVMKPSCLRNDPPYNIGFNPLQILQSPHTRHDYSLERIVVCIRILARPNGCQSPGAGQQCAVYTS